MLECDKSKCTGCGVCSLVCPKGCITMEESIDGFLYPNVYEQLCVNCNLCNKVCHLNVNENLPIDSHDTLYAAWNNDEIKRHHGSSGGIFQAFADYYIKNGWSVVAAMFIDENFHLEHKITDSETDIYAMCKSKYFQSVTYKTFTQVKQRLTDNKHVLFVGTPCQVAALKSYVGNDSPYLFTVDILCHGVPSYKMFIDHVRFVESKENKRVTSVKLRYKAPGIGWKDSCRMYMTFSDGSVYHKNSGNDMFQRAFLSNISLRDSCYSCVYSGKKRVGDITIGDYWGVGREDKFDYPIFNGVSLLSINTKKGETLIEHSKDYITLVKRCPAEGIHNNFSLTAPAQYTSKAQRFKKRYKGKNFDRTVRNVLKWDLLGDTVKKNLGDGTVGFIRKVKHMAFKKGK